MWLQQHRILREVKKIKEKQTIITMVAGANNSGQEQLAKYNPLPFTATIMLLRHHHQWSREREGKRGRKLQKRGLTYLPNIVKENGFYFPGQKSVCLLFTKGIKGLQISRRNGNGGPEAVDVVVPFWTLVFLFSLPFPSLSHSWKWSADIEAPPSSGTYLPFSRGLLVSDQARRERSSFSRPTILNFFKQLDSSNHFNFFKKNNYLFFFKLFIFNFQIV